MTSRNKMTQRISLLFYLFVGLMFVLLTNIGMGEDLGNDIIVNRGIDETPGSGSYDSVLVTGKDSTLIVEGTDHIGGNGSLFVTDNGTVNLEGTGQLTFTHNAVFDKGYLNQAAGSTLAVGDFILFDNGTVANSAGILKVTGATGGVSVKNGSTLNVAGADGVLRITGGGLTFDDTSTLGITIGKDIIGNGISGLIDAGGHGVALDGYLVVSPEYGYYTNSITDQLFITNSSGISGTFDNDNVRLSNSRFGTLKAEVVNNGTIDEAFLTFNPYDDPFSNFTQTSNEYNVGLAFNKIHEAPGSFESLMRTMWNMSDADLRVLYNDLSGEIRADTMAMPLASPGRMAFDRVGWDSANGHVFFGPQYRLAARGSNRATWFRPYYLDNTIESDGKASGYTMDGYGFTAGIDQTLTGGKTAVGVMLGYGRPELSKRNDKAKLDDFLIGAYIATRCYDAWEIKAWGGFGYQYYDMQRQVNLPEIAGRSQFKSSFKGHTTTLSGELARPIYTMSRLVLKPTVGYDGLFLTQEAGDETGHSLVALSYHKTSIERHIGRLGVNAEYGDSARSLYGGAHYKYLLGGDQVYYSKASFAGGGPAFIVEGVDLGKAFISANIGLQINLSDDRSRLIFVDYTADFGDNSAYYQIATFGLQQTF